MRFEPRKPIFLNYAVRNFRTGQTVSVSVYDEKGNEVLASASMIELCSTGIYVYRWVPSHSGTYFAYADCVEYPKKAFQTLVVGGKPGDMKMGGLMPRGIESVWKEEEKKLLMSVVGKLGKKVGVLHDAQLKIEKELKEFSKLNNLKEEKSNKRFDNLAVKINSYSKSHEHNLNVINRSFERMRELSQGEFNSLKKDIHEDVSNLNLLTDDMNVSLKSLGHEPDTQVTAPLANYFPLIDEAILNSKGGKNGTTANGST